MRDVGGHVDCKKNGITYFFYFYQKGSFEILFQIFIVFMVLYGFVTQILKVEEVSVMFNTYEMQVKLSKPLLRFLKLSLQSMCFEAKT